MFVLKGLKDNKWHSKVRKTPATLQSNHWKYFKCNWVIKKYLPDNKIIQAPWVLSRTLAHGNRTVILKQDETMEVTTPQSSG